VTASVDGMQAFSDINADENLRLEGYLTWVGTSSMEVHVNILSVPSPANSAPRLAGSTQFIMVARNRDTGKSYQVPGLEMSEVELSTGQKRANRRKQLAANSLQLRPPAKDEVDLLHKLYLVKVS
jgi:acyl-coenzyme A thioesterase 9